MTSFKAPQPTPLGMVLTIARAVGLVSAVDDVVIVPSDKWHAMHERHEADALALRSALARVVEVETRANQNERDRRDPVARAQVAEAAERRLTAEVARLVAELAVARGQP